MKRLFQPVFLSLFIIYFTVAWNNFVSAETEHQIDLNIVDRLARIEESQKAIISEMQTRFEAVDKRFEAIDKRFEAVDKRFESVDKRFEAILREMSQRFESVDKRFESMLREMTNRFESVDKRMDSLDKRIDSLDKRIDQLGNYIIAMTGTFLSIFLAVIGYAIWDRKTLLEKAEKKTVQLIQEHQVRLSPINAQEKLNQVIEIMKHMSEKFPEMRTMMHAAQLL
ncbi:MAG: hypothetical protein HQK75_08870 [Candidatus Magnetomorum sp.]|nr:hypothetical protein [Candidatus Magnetomorum sp.]